MTLRAVPILAMLAGTGSARADSVHAGPMLGIAVPRNELDIAPLVGAVATVKLDRHGAWTAGAAIDWVHTGRQDAVLFTPAPFPRSRGEVEETADLLTFALLGSARIATVGTSEIRLRVAAGLQTQRTRFAAYTMETTDTGVGPSGTVGVAVEGRASAIGWSMFAGWREARRSLGTAQAYATETISGALLIAGATF